MTSGFSIQLCCTHCSTPIHIPYHPNTALPWVSCCPGCGKQFGIESGSIARQIQLFIALCQQLKASEEILSTAAIAVSVGSTEVKIPFRLLLTRLKSTLDLNVGGKKISISSRADPIKIGEAITQEELSWQ